MVLRLPTTLELVLGGNEPVRRRKGYSLVIGLSVRFPLGVGKVAFASAQQQVVVGSL